MEVNDELIEQYYHKIISMFGHIDYTGAYNLAVAVSLYKLRGINLKDLYNDMSEVLGISGAAIERSIRVYLKAILEDKTIDEVSTMIGYPLRNITNYIQAKEFIAALKLFLEQE